MKCCGFQPRPAPDEVDGAGAGTGGISVSHLAAWARDLENDEARELEENQGIDQHTFVRILENYPKKDERYVYGNYGYIPSLQPL